MKVRVGRGELAAYDLKAAAEPAEYPFQGAIHREHARKALCSPEERATISRIPPSRGSERRGEQAKAWFGNAKLPQCVREGPVSEMKLPSRARIPSCYESEGCVRVCKAVVRLVKSRVVRIEASVKRGEVCGSGVDLPVGCHVIDARSLVVGGRPRDGIVRSAVEVHHSLLQSGESMSSRARRALPAVRSSTSPSKEKTRAARGVVRAVQMSTSAIATPS
jgi:hypothetical protein